jgi:hypothetical protein
MGCVGLREYDVGVSENVREGNVGGERELAKMLTVSS